MARRQVCVLLADHAEALEERGVIPDCEFHEHISHGVADELLGPLERDPQTNERYEGWGRARTVRGMDGRRRITAIPVTTMQPTPSKIKRPTSLNYPIPAVVDHRIRWFNSFMIPEGRKLEAY